MAAGIEHLLELYKGLQLVTPSPTDDGRGEQLRQLPYNVPHLHAMSLQVSAIRGVGVGESEVPHDGMWPCDRRQAV